MNSRPIATAAVLAGLLLSSPGAVAQANTTVRKADAVYRNATVYTIDELTPWAEAIAVKYGRILETGSEADIRGYVGEKTTVIDLEGRFVLPGLHDSRVHPILGGLKTRGLFVHPDRDAAEVAALIGDYARDHPRQRIIVACGFGMQVRAYRSVFDAAVPDHPVFVEGFGGHSLWLNSWALALAGIDRDTATPPGGAIIRDEKDGALAMGTVDSTGSIEAGKWADFVVLDRNLFTIPVAQISEAAVELTVFERKIVYRKNAAQ